MSRFRFNGSSFALVSEAGENIEGRIWPASNEYTPSVLRLIWASKIYPTPGSVDFDRRTRGEVVEALGSMVRLLDENDQGIGIQLARDHDRPTSRQFLVPGDGRLEVRKHYTAPPGSPAKDYDATLLIVRADSLDLAGHSMQFDGLRPQMVEGVAEWLSAQDLQPRKSIWS